MNSFKKKERLSFEMALVARQLRPWNLSPWVAFALGIFMGLVFVLFEARLEKVTLKRLIGAAVGSIVGILGAWMVSLLLVGSLAVRGNTVSFIQICLLMLMGYVGLILGANKGDLLNLSALGGLSGVSAPPAGLSRFWIRASLSTAASPTWRKPDSWTACW